MKHFRKTQFLSWFLTVVMVFGLCPTNVFATNGTEVQGESVEKSSSEDLQIYSEEEKTTEEEKNEEKTTEEEKNTIDDSNIVDDGVMPVDSGEFSNSNLSVVSNKKSTLATGVTENKYTVFDKNGNQVKMFVATADPSVETVKMYASYLDMNPTKFGMSKLTEQVAAFDKKAADGDPYYQGTVVAGINASYYNMTTGQPSGIFVMNGVVGNSDESAGYFAVMKDGSVKIGVKGDYAEDAGNIQEAIGIYTMLIVDGEICDGLDEKTKYPRQTIGITADGKVILMSADGNQAPTSVGLTILEQAQVMKDLGCVWAGHLDGGGSMTYGSRPEGSDTFQIVNSPSDGSERSISNGFIIVSTEEQSKEFSKVKFDVESEYLTPGTAINVKTAGVSQSGAAAEIPDGVTFEATNGTYADGVLTAGEVGDVVLTAKLNNKEVGSVTVHCVVPENIKFASESITIPYGKTVALTIVATYGLNEVMTKAADFSFALANEKAGTIQGMDFTAAEESEISNTTITATFAGTELTASAALSFGKGSEVLKDFEDQDLGNMNIFTGYPQYGPDGANGQNELGNIYIVNETTGKVHDGNYALAVECDYSQAYETGYHLLNLNNLNLDVPANAQTIGMWLYLPELEELYTTSMRFMGNTAGSTTNDVSSPWLWDNCEPYGWENDGWRYVTMDISSYGEMTINTLQLYICDRDNSSNGFYFKDHASVNGRFTYYVDNITIDYSSAVEDRENPVFKSVNAYYSGLSDAVAMDGQTITSNVVSVVAQASDDMTKSNYTGLDASSAKVYLDGVRLTSGVTCSDTGAISVDDVTLADGTHTFRFEICDKNGNLGYAERQITVNAQSGMPTISIIPENPNADKILIGSLYWVDLVATKANLVDTATVVLNLNSMSQWELDHMVATSGFEAAYEVDEVTNNATITVTKTGEVADDATVLVRMPIRTWESRLTEYKGYEDQTPQKLWSRKIIWPIDIKLNANYGAVTFTDGTTGSFSMKKLAVITELYGNYGELNANGDYANKTSWHIHTAQALPDQAATCTEAGYTGRTYCEVCNSVVEWGTSIPATGHSYDFVDGVLKCACGETFTGTWSDGKEYVDGVCQTDGWAGDSYYVDGVKLTGVQKVAAPDGSGEFYYDFGTDGICANRVKYTGLFYDESVSAYRYSKLGELAGGWHQIDENWHYFKSNSKVAASGEYTVSGVVFTFDETGMTKGAWHNNSTGIRYYYGPAYYQAANPGYMKLVEIDGKTYNFDNNGYITPGIQVLRDSTAFKKYVFEFGEDGAMISKIKDEQIIEISGAFYYITSNGYVEMDTGLFQYNGDYYYTVHSGKLKQNGNQTITEAQANKYSDVEAGTYYFGADCKMVIPELEPEEKNGIYQEDGIYVYYVDGVKQKNRGLIQIDDAYYYVCYSGKLKQNGNQTINEAQMEKYPELGLAAGSYYFGADCKMVIPEPEPEEKNGIYQEGGIYVYYVDGVKQKNRGLIQIDDAYYYVCYSGKLKQNGNQTINEAQMEKYPELGLAAGSYYFGADCKMVIPEPEPEEKNGIYQEGDIYVYYVDGSKQKNLGLIQVDSSYYYVCYSGKLKQNGYQTITEAQANKYSDVESGTYYFDADCKMQRK